MHADLFIAAFSLFYFLQAKKISNNFRMKYEKVFKNHHKFNFIRDISHATATHR